MLLCDGFNSRTAMGTVGTVYTYIHGPLIAALARGGFAGSVGSCPPSPQRMAAMAEATGLIEPPVVRPYVTPEHYTSLRLAGHP